MKIKLDENLPVALAADLARQGHDVDTVHDEGLRGQADNTVWSAVQDAGRFLITQDLDFSDVRRFEPGTHHGLLLVRLHEPGRVALRERVRAAFESCDLAEWAGSFVVLTDHKLRVRKAQ